MLRELFMFNQGLGDCYWLTLAEAKRFIIVNEMDILRFFFAPNLPFTPGSIAADAKLGVIHFFTFYPDNTAAVCDIVGRFGI